MFERTKTSSEGWELRPGRWAEHGAAVCLRPATFTQLRERQEKCPIKDRELVLRVKTSPVVPTVITT